MEEHEFAQAADRIRSLRVGGSFWGRQPHLPPRYLLVTKAEALPAAQALAGEHAETLLWLPNAPRTKVARPAIIGECDPWHMLSSASGVVCDADDEVRAVAALCGIPIYIASANSVSEPSPEDDAAFLRARLQLCTNLANPFDGAPMSLHEAVELCGHWRCLIDSNRQITGAVGIAFWKQQSVAPLLWSGEQELAEESIPDVASRSPCVAVWRARTPADTLEKLERGGTRLIEIEDGFLRSNGLGADCVPPLSITVDRLGAHFDPSRPSELEQLLQAGEFDSSVLERARRLREAIVTAGLGKYGRATDQLARPAGDRHHILVPGQVEDDRSVLAGGCGLTSNLELLRRVRALEPDAFIIYKPHPDVLSGHRKGSVDQAACLQSADLVAAPSQPISSLLAMVDGVHVNTSLAGFEALMRGKEVTTHGVPFYAGWGLTTDLGPVPPRRSQQLSIDALVAGTLLMYPRYIDPETGLPCPAEIVVARLSGESAVNSSALVAARRLQGRLRRLLRSLTA